MGNEEKGQEWALVTAYQERTRQLHEARGALAECVAAADRRV
jgi:hypothetical protein